MRLNSLFFLLREAVASLVRHRLMTLAAVSTSAICFTIVGMFLAALLTLHALTERFTSELGILVFMNTRAPRAQTLAARDKLAGLPGVASVKLVTREEAWKRMKRDMGSQVPLQGVKGNPLGDELHVDLRDVDHIMPVSRAAGRVSGVAEVSVMRDVVRKVQDTERLLKKLAAGAAGGLMLATMVVIANVIRLTVFARRREIHIMQLVGATNAFIRMPFLLEGLFYGATGAAVAAAVVYYGGRSLLQFSQRALPFLPLNPADLPTDSLVIALVLVGAGIGLTGSAASVRRFLRT